MLDILLTLFYIILIFVFIRFFVPLAWGFYGLIFCITVVMIPFGLKCLKIARLNLFPYKKSVITNFESHPIANILWCVFIGFRFAFLHLLCGAILHLTVIGIPYGKSLFKSAKIALLPFGATIHRSGS